MGFFDFFKQPDINEEAAKCRETNEAILLDVRTPQEYAEGHIPGSENLPLQIIDQAPSVIQDKSAALCVYCLSGVRSSQAVSALKQMGYTNVKNIGGISSYTGKIEKNV